MKRFFTPHPLSPGNILSLDKEESKHALKVLRLKVGDSIALINGTGLEARAEILSIENALLQTRVVEIQRNIKEKAKLILLQGILKGPRMDWLVEKVTELGVHSLCPVITEFSVAHQEKEDRWNRIALSALKQSGHLCLLKIHPLTPMENMLKNFSHNDFKIVLDPNAEKSLLCVMESLRTTPPPSYQGSIILAVGPEGGFSAKENHLLTENGFHPAKLSTQILRGETAGIATAAIAMHFIDFSVP